VSKAIFASLLLAFSCDHPMETHDAVFKSDASAEDSSTALVDATLNCDPTSPFGLAVPVAGLSTAADEDGASYSPDELTVYFNRNISDVTSWDVWMSTRASRTEPFGTGSLLVAINTKGIERGVSVSADQRELYVTHWSATGDADIRVSVRASLTDPFLADTPLFTGPARDSWPHITPDHTLYLSSDRTGANALHVATWDGSAFSSPTPVAGIDLGDSAGDLSPVVSPDGLTLYYASYRAGGAGLADIWTTTRSSATAPFGPSTNVAELNTTEADYPNWISSDGCELTFTRWVDGSRYELMTAARGL